MNLMLTSPVQYRFIDARQNIYTQKGGMMLLIIKREKKTTFTKMVREEKSRVILPMEFNCNLWKRRHIFPFWFSAASFLVSEREP
jgi:hypothetical protein